MSSNKPNKPNKPSSDLDETDAGGGREVTTAPALAAIQHDALFDDVSSLGKSSQESETRRIGKQSSDSVKVLTAGGTIEFTPGNVKEVSRKNNPSKTSSSDSSEGRTSILSPPQLRQDDESDKEKDTEQMVQEMLKGPTSESMFSMFSGKTGDVKSGKYGGFQYQFQRKPSQSSITGLDIGRSRRSDLFDVDITDDFSVLSHELDVELQTPQLSCLKENYKEFNEPQKRSCFSLTSSVLVVSLLLSVLLIVGSASAGYLYSNMRLVSASIVQFPSTSIGHTDEAVVVDSLGYLADMTSPLKETDIPFFFHVPLTLGIAVQLVLGQCYDLVQASSFWAKNTNSSEPLQVLYHSDYRLDYINVDTISPDDVTRAINLGLADSNIVDIVTSAQLHLTATLFNPMHEGRMFTLLRHPIERALHMYDKERSRNDAVAEMSLTEYADSSFIMSNWLTRTLTKEKGRITENHVTLAKELLKKKCLIGLLTELQESFRRFEIYFRFRPLNGTDCQQKIVDRSLKKNEFGLPMVTEGSVEWNALLRHNSYDLEIYNYALELFDEQGIMLSNGFFI